MLKILGIITTIITLSSSVAIAADLSGARGTLNNIDSAINDTVTKAARLFEENQGEAMTADFNVLKAGQNPYLEVLRVTKDYMIEIKLAGSAKKTDNYITPVAKGLLGVDIVLVPVYQKGDEKITSWECVTNADRNIQEFMGDTAKEYSASFIRDASNNTYLSLCTFVNKDLVKK